MSKLTERIQLTHYDRDLILKYGYPFERLKKACIAGRIIRQFAGSR